YLAPLSLAQGNLRFAKKIKLFGVAGFHYFSPRLVVRELTKAYHRLGMHSEISCGMVKLRKIRPGPVSAYDLALWLDHPDHVGEVIKQVLPQLEQEERIGFPAILGLGNHRQVLTRIEKETGKKVFEIPTVPPSVPGIRLHQHLFMMMRKKGIDCIIGYPAAGAEINGDRISSVRVNVPGKNITFSGKKYILAAGGLGSEGLVAGPGWIKEPLFNLPVYNDQEVGRWSTSKLLEEQPYACFGLRVDEKMHPLDAEGHICLENLHAAGSIIAYFDGVAERSTGGVDIATGFMAGKECGGEV
ncbi:MAG: FAD-binding protein, partial [Dehalobacterium sp.]